VAFISGVQLLDTGGRPAGRLRAGQPAALEMTVHAAEPLTDFVFGFRVVTVAGMVVFGINTALEGLRPSRFAGAARVTLSLPSLDLAPGVYSLDAAIHARDGAPYDYRRDVLRFEVTSEVAAAGVWSPRRTWDFEGDVEWQEGTGSTRRS